jgi:hypothetical protein
MSVLRAVERALPGEASGDDRGGAGGKGGRSEWKVLRDAGNRLFESGKYAQAGEKYSDALMFISLSDRAARIHLLCNRALAHLEGSKFSEAMWDCESVLHLAPQHQGSAALAKALYLKGMAHRGRGNIEAARAHLRQVRTLSSAKPGLLAQADREHLQLLLKELADAETDALPGIAAKLSYLLRCLVIYAAGFFLWSLAPLVVLMGIWTYMSVRMNVDSGKDGLLLDVQRAQIMAALGAFGITTLWHMWGRWEAAEKKRRGAEFRSMREHVLGWWAVTRALGVRTGCLVLQPHNITHPTPHTTHRMLRTSQDACRTPNQSTIP